MFGLSSEKAEGGRAEAFFASLLCLLAVCFSLEVFHILCKLCFDISLITKMFPDHVHDAFS